MIRSSKHSIKFSNNTKLETINSIINEYQLLTQLIINTIWASGISGYKLNIKNNKLDDCPSVLPNSFLKQFDTWLSARMKQAAGKQVCSMIKASINKRKRQLFVLRKNQRLGIKCSKLQSKIDRQPLVKPNASNVNVELDSRFTDFQDSSSHFDLFIRLKSIGNKISLNIPIKHNKTSLKWLSKGTLKPSIRLSSKNVYLYFEVDKATISGTRTVGCDQGVLATATLSDQQTTPKCPHGHDLSSIQQRLACRQKGSRGFRRAQNHRQNYINWSLKQLDFSNIKELRLEKVYQLRTGKRSSRILSHWSYKLIKDQLSNLAEVKGFNLAEVDNKFRSQRCSSCGWVRKANRVRKTFKCTSCEFTCDADLNAAINLELDLIEVPNWVRLQNLNRQGFYWNSNSLNFVGQEPIVPDTLVSEIP